MSKRAKAFLVVSLVAVLSGAGIAPGQPAGPRLKEVMTAAEFERCGLQKLTPAELAALETWLTSGHNHGGGKVPGAVLPLTGATRAPPRSTEIVAFNTSNGKYHCVSCQWALRCTRNCVNVPVSEARARGVACKVCGGTCR